MSLPDRSVAQAAGAAAVESWMAVTNGMVKPVSQRTAVSEANQVIAVMIPAVGTPAAYVKVPNTSTFTLPGKAM